MINQIELKAAICSDDSEFLSEFSFMIRLNPSYLLDFYTTPNQFLSNASNYDIVFIDYDMKKSRGIKLLEEIDDLPVFKVLVTKNEYIVNKNLAYTLFYFMRKHRCVEDYIRIQTKLTNYYSTTSKKIIFTSNPKIFSFYLNKINYIEINKHELIIHTNHTYRIRSTFQAILEQFKDTSFLMPCYGVLVNPEYVKVFDKKLATITLYNDQIFTISKSCKKECILKYDNYVTKYMSKYTTP